jgi:hypothetical protein
VSGSERIKSTASSASPRLRSFVAMPACVLLPTAAGARLFKANCYDIATNGSAGLRRGRLGCHRLLGLLRGLLQTQASACKKPSLTILATARLMARITWQLLTQRRVYTSLAKDPIPPKTACRADHPCSGRLGQGTGRKCSTDVDVIPARGVACTLLALANPNRLWGPRLRRMIARSFSLSV